MRSSKKDNIRKVDNVLFGAFSRTGTTQSDETNLSYDVSESVQGYNPVENDFIDTSRLYPDPSKVENKVTQITLALERCVKHLDKAVEYNESAEYAAADNEIIQIQMMMPELFCMRSNGTGFAYFVLSVEHAIRNQEDKTFDHNQLITLRYAFKLFLNSPLASLEDAIDIVTPLEECGLQLEPTSINTLHNEIASA